MRYRGFVNRLLDFIWIIVPLFMTNQIRSLLKSKLKVFSKRLCNNWFYSRNISRTPIPWTGLGIFWRVTMVSETWLQTWLNWFTKQYQWQLGLQNKGIRMWKYQKVWNKNWKFQTITFTFYINKWYKFEISRIKDKK